MGLDCWSFRRAKKKKGYFIYLQWDWVAAVWMDGGGWSDEMGGRELG